MKHTQGQWFISNQNNELKVKVRNTMMGTICTINEDYYNLDQDYNNEVEANASLIASAPDMANLLEWIIAEIENTPDTLSNALLGLIKLKAKHMVDNLNK
jgi:vacuolar-type H+-ATPase subunit D/Vma8